MSENRATDTQPNRTMTVSLGGSLVVQARESTINVSGPCEAGLETAVRQARAEHWHEENAAGFEAWNDYVDRHGVPLAGYRKF